MFDIVYIYKLTYSSTLYNYDIDEYFTCVDCLLSYVKPH